MFWITDLFFGGGGGICCCLLAFLIYGIASTAMGNTETWKKGWCKQRHKYTCHICLKTFFFTPSVQQLLNVIVFRVLLQFSCRRHIRNSNILWEDNTQTPLFILDFFPAICSFCCFKKGYLFSIFVTFCVWEYISSYFDRLCHCNNYKQSPILKSAF